MVQYSIHMYYSMEITLLVVLHIHTQTKVQNMLFNLLLVKFLFVLGFQTPAWS